jgi:outer membrane protein TolC
MRTSAHMLLVRVIICTVAVAVAGCSPAYYRSSADREVYGIIEQKSPKVPGMPGAFTIEQPQQDFLTGLPVAAAPQAPAPPASPAPQTGEAGQLPPAAPVTATPPAPDPPAVQTAQPGEGGQIPPAAPVAPAAPPAQARQTGEAGQVPPALPTARAPQAAQAPQAGQEGEVPPSEATQTPLSPEAREALRAPEEDEAGAYIITLDKALEIATLNSRDYQTQKESLYQRALSLTSARYQFLPHFFGMLAGDYQATGLGDEKQVSANTNVGFSWLLATGARVSTSLSSSFSKFLTGQPREAASSLFNLAITQPILQGAGIAVTEPLTQAERSVLYQIRSFVQYRRSFFVGILSNYYRVVQQRQILRNQIENYRRQLFTLDRAEWTGRAGRMARNGVDQIRQAVLSSEAGVVQARQSYQNALDQFKITLGLPTEARIVLDPKELERLKVEGIVNIDLRQEQIEQIALQHRLDLMVARDQVEDAKRKVKVGKNGLLPVLDLSASLSSATGPTQPLNFTSDNTNAGIGFELDLPLDRLSERNDYRSKLIAFAQAQRAYALTRDQVVQDVRNDWREYVANRRSYQIQVESEKLATTRVESSMMSLEAGRAEARDVLEAQASLLGAQNSLAQALVSFKIASLALARDMDILIVGEKGQLKEGFDEYK